MPWTRTRRSRTLAAFLLANICNLAFSAFSQNAAFDRVGYIRVSVDWESSSKPRSETVVLALEKINAISGNQMPIADKKYPQDIIWTASGNGTWKTMTKHQFVVSLEADTTTSQWLLALSFVDDSGATHSIQNRIISMNQQRPVYELQWKAFLENSGRTTAWRQRFWHLAIALACTMATIIMARNGLVSLLLGQATENDQDLNDDTLPVQNGTEQEMAAPDASLGRTSRRSGQEYSPVRAQRQLVSTPPKDTYIIDDGYCTELSRQLEASSEDDDDEEEIPCCKPPTIQRKQELAKASTQGRSMFDSGAMLQSPCFAPTQNHLASHQTILLPFAPTAAHNEAASLHGRALPEFSSVTGDRHVDLLSFRPYRASSGPFLDWSHRVYSQGPGLLLPTQGVTSESDDLPESDNLFAQQQQRMVDRPWHSLSEQGKLTLRSAPRGSLAFPANHASIFDMMKSQPTTGFVADRPQESAPSSIPGYANGIGDTVSGPSSSIPAVKPIHRDADFQSHQESSPFIRNTLPAQQYPAASFRSTFTMKPTLSTASGEANRGDSHGSGTTDDMFYSIDRSMAGLSGLSIGRGKCMVSSYPRLLQLN